ncbi:protein-glutamate O-methyltransferase CheR [Paraglaciecola sp. MB-3u-78]|uniref:CheR family methyltransferase n=1 Tax=Paraglaciecola sp. MB-3u-78 TaxID=2058332 RepID=UPI000C344ED6|nr:protein-glutamate O-methyltransferase CheR [Paraglaciecola sp. MB-3u-78]PKG98145.1 SAM-dependent methyltransferase [Paraglaciecola sp. MB-3u-78]
MFQERISDAEFNRFKDFIYDRAGIRLSDEKKTLVTSRLSKRLRHYSMTSFGTYFDLMTELGREKEQQIVIDLLTTNETFFFREPKHFEFLANDIIPTLNRNKRFRVWSAASSTGKEAYSVAMLLDDKLNNNLWEILGSDINHTVLQEAALGLYQQDRIDGIPADYLKKYCFKGKDEFEGKLLIDKGLIDRVKFIYVNLTLPLDEFGTFQLILLRNVLIYFDNETKSQIIKKVVLKLESGGFLFIGHAESLKGFTHGLIRISSSIYKKP